MFSGFLTPVLTQLFFPKPPSTFLTCVCIGERRKYAAKKSRLNRGSNSQPPGHESDTLTTEPPGRGFSRNTEICLGMGRKHCGTRGPRWPWIAHLFFEIALANVFFFFVTFREEFTRIASCLYSARSLHSLIPCLLTDQNFKNSSEKGHSRNISEIISKSDQ